MECLEEDVSDPTVLGRHQRSEELERLRFASHVAGGLRSGRSRQRGAMAGATTTANSSTGTNTPGNNYQIMHKN